MDGPHSEFNLVGITEIYFWLILALFVLVFGLFMPAVLATRQDSKIQGSNMQRWKNFWNSVELIWLIGAFLAIFIAIPSAWSVVSIKIADGFRASAVEELKVVREYAERAYSNHCKENLSAKT